jgi:hypothetical protein
MAGSVLHFLVRLNGIGRHVFGKEPKTGENIVSASAGRSALPSDDAERVGFMTGSAVGIVGDQNIVACGQ